MTPILIGACDSPGIVSPAIATRRRATNTTDRLLIESLLRDRDVPARIAHDLTGGKRVYSRGLDGDGREILRRGGEAAGRNPSSPGRGGAPWRAACSRPCSTCGLAPA